MLRADIFADVTIVISNASNMNRALLGSHFQADIWHNKYNYALCKQYLSKRKCTAPSGLKINQENKVEELFKSMITT